MKVPIAALRTDQSGATAVEYGFILALVVIAVMAAIMSVADRTTTIWNNVSSNVAGAR